MEDHEQLRNRPKGTRHVVLINLSGPYGVGKDSILSAVLAALGEGGYRVGTITTRPVSPELDSSYKSLSPAEFDRVASSGRWLVNEQIGGKVKYGTSVDEIEVATLKGQVGALSVYPGPAGAGRLREFFGSRLLSFGVLATGRDDETEFAELERRLRSRGRDDARVIAERLAYQGEKIAYIRNNPIISTPDGPMRTFDGIIVNVELPVAISEVLQKIRSRQIL